LLRALPPPLCWYFLMQSPSEEVLSPSLVMVPEMPN
jgi:hypothetical protein